MAHVEQIELSSDRYGDDIGQDPLNIVDIMEVSLDQEHEQRENDVTEHGFVSTKLLPHLASDINTEAIDNTINHSTNENVTYIQILN